MSIANSFPVFEQDQVLTNQHLNDLFNYLDQQDRLTRCKLLGSGIVCGLDISSTSDTINITKGCGLTSQGYLVLFCDHLGDDGYKFFMPFTRPAFPKDLKLIKQCAPQPDTTNLLFYAQPNINTGDVSATEFLLLTRKEMEDLIDKTGVVPISQAALDEYAVVLFLDGVENNLKNCDTNDCNNKGSVIDFEIKPLLVNKKILTGNNGTGLGGDLEHIDMRRYNIPRKALNSTDAVLNAFVDIVNDQTLELLAKDLDICFNNYKSLLNGINTSPFGDAADFKKMLQFTINFYPFLLQYYYAFIKDLVKALCEFRYKVYAIASECCFDEMAFPFHLTLGEATANTALGGQLAYRQYFIYSPLFDGQNGRAETLKSLLMRMILMYQNYLFTTAVLSPKNNKPRLPNETRITPSMYKQYALSEGSIPYYYSSVREKNDPIAEDLYYYWNYDKTKRGDARRNLGYNAEDYSQVNAITQPLFYDIEHYNFFRIEGHIGKNIEVALTEIETIRQNFSLPFNVVALSADFIGALLKGEEPKCCIKHLEADYRVLIAGFICTLHDSLCYAARRAYKPPVQIFVTGIFPENSSSAGAKKTGAAKKTAETAASAAAAEAISATSFINNKIDIALEHPFVSSLVNEFQAIAAYTKGSTLSRLCAPPAGTFGSYYTSSVAANKGVFVNPFPADSAGGDLLNHHLFEFIDSAESMFQILMNQDLSALDTVAFKTAYKRFEKEVVTINLSVIALLEALAENGKTKEFAIDTIMGIFEYQVQLALHTCIVEELEALKNELRRWLAEAQLAKNIDHYSQHHPGLTPGCGVPVGGTLALAYREERKGRFVDVNAIFVNNNLRTLLVSNFKELLQPDVTPDTLEEKAQQLSLMAVQNDPFVYAQFTNVMRQYIDDCKDLSDEKRKQLISIIRQPPPGQTYEIKDGMVIADFYLPYLCCSDCPPIAYILPPITTEPPPVETVFDIQPRVFLFDEAKNYPFTTKPAVTTAGVEQNPFTSADISNPDPDKLTIWTDESNILYLHPAMELKQTIKKTISYKNVSLEITIIKPDASFTAQVSLDPTGGNRIYQLEAQNKDATEYRWVVNGKLLSPTDNPANKTARPAPFSLPAGGAAAQVNVELTISYTLNDNISEDTQTKNVGPNTPLVSKAAKKPKKK